MSEPPWLIERRNRVARRWDLNDEVVLIPAGEPVPMPGRDFPYPFRVHPEHRYLADTDIPGAVLAFDATEGSWTLFTPRPDADDKVWNRATPPRGRDRAELDAWLDERSGRPLIDLADDSRPHPLSTKLTDERLVKDDEELDRMRRAAAATAAGFEAFVAGARPGVTEHQLRADIEAAFLRAGAEHTAYGSIVAAGSNAAVLHFHPGHRAVGHGELVLVDAGAELEGYACDVTRTLVVGEPSEAQRRIWEIVRSAQVEAVAACRPGVEYRQIHLDTATTMARGLVDMGLLRGRPDDLVARGAMALFFPHGVGHLIGLAVHDPGGYAPGREPSPAAGLRYLRCDRPLVENMTVTIEPGIYLIEPLLGDPDLRARYADDVDWNLADELIELGGVRIEDTVLVTAQGGEPLTGDIPKLLTAD